MENNRLTNVQEDRNQPRNINLFLRYACLVALFGFRLFFLSIIVQNMNNEPAETQKCQCAVFPAFTYLSEADTETTIVNTSLVNKKNGCDAQGAKHCMTVCSWVVQITPAVYWKKTCAKEKNYKEFRAFVYYRPCSNSKWYPGKKPMITIYCIDGEAYSNSLNREAPRGIPTDK